MTESIKEQMKTLVSETSEILSRVDRKIRIMEVCGTHTMEIAKSGIRHLLPESIEITSGPGCPVCVSSSGELDLALQCAAKENVIVTTFGDMLKVPLDGDSLGNHKSVKMVYSPLDSLNFATNNPEKEIVFLAIGFETTAPLVAATIMQAKSLNISNFSIISMHKVLPPALRLIASDPNSAVDGFLLPGHAAAVTGKRYFNFMKKYKKPGVVAGFEPLDIARALKKLCQLVADESPEIGNEYTRVVSDEGNVRAMVLMGEVFEVCDSVWRGIGNFPESGLKLREQFKMFDAKAKLKLEERDVPESPGCLCGKILMGQASPPDCSHFGKSCIPAEPIGPCMVSSEGTCAAYFKYGKRN